VEPDLHPRQSSAKPPSSSVAYSPIALAAGDRNTIQNALGWCLKPWHRLPVDGFDCGDADLNDYFSKDAIEARNLMTCETFALTHWDIPDGVVGLVSVCNDVVEVKKLQLFPQFKNTPAAKLTYKEWPAVKIARLGVRQEVQGKNVGTHIINLLKTLFVTDNRTGCRIMTVDAYNKPPVLRFYERNEFQFLTEKDKNRNSRAMWFDLLPWRNSLNQALTQPRNQV
jgi:GNAT superfamily N-acetyltransferase